MSGWRQPLSATLLHLRWWPSPRRAGELAAHSVAPPRAGLQRPLLRPPRGEGQHGVGFGCSCTGSFPGWGSAGSWLLQGFALLVVSGAHSLVAVHGLLLAAASPVTGCSSGRAWAQQLWTPGCAAQVQWLWCKGLAPLTHVGSSWTKD